MRCILANRGKAARGAGIMDSVEFHRERSTLNAQRLSISAARILMAIEYGNIFARENGRRLNCGSNDIKYVTCVALPKL